MTIMVQIIHLMLKHSANYAAGYIDEAEATLGDGSPDYTKWDLAAERTYEKCQDTLGKVLKIFEKKIN